MLMAWGRFRFTVPNYSVETIRRSIQPRVEPQPVIGAAPKLHRLGPGSETISLESTFHPHHLNGKGLAQLAGVRQAVNELQPLPLVHINGSAMNIFGLWVATGLDDEHTVFDHAGVPSIVSTTLQMIRYDQSTARQIAIGAVLGNINFSLSLRLGF